MFQPEGIRPLGQGCLHALDSGRRRAGTPLPPFLAMSLALRVGIDSRGLQAPTSERQIKKALSINKAQPSFHSTGGGGGGGTLEEKREESPALSFLERGE